MNKKQKKQIFDLALKYDGLSDEALKAFGIEDSTYQYWLARHCTVVECIEILGIYDEYIQYSIK